MHIVPSIVTRNWAGLLVAVLSFACPAFDASAQARLVINNNAWVRVDNGAWVVIENQAPTGLQTLGTGGNIRSEGEFNRIRWQIRNGVGSYVVPFTTASGVKMPLTYTVVGAGSNDTQASICFSTFNHASAGIPLANAWNNDLYKPTDVTHMDSYNAPLVPNSQNAVDRFWIIDPGVPGYAYGTRPSIALNFVYDASVVVGEVTTGNAIGPTDPVGAQRFNSPAGLWGDFLPVGTFNPGTPSSVTGATAGPADFFRSWTLANIFEPLPVELLGFDAECVGSSVVLEWSTASENNSSHFVVERSSDGSTFDPVGRVEAAGFSQATMTYTFMDNASPGSAYYRLRSVDLDGTWTLGRTIVISCGGSGGLDIISAWDSGTELNISIRSSIAQAAVLRVYDMGGKLVHTRATDLIDGVVREQLPRATMANGIYVVRLDTPEGALFRRVNVLE